MFGLKQKRRQRIRNLPFPEKWQEILEKNIVYYHHLNSADQAELRGHMQIFLNEKKFEGFDGLEITEEIKVTIAAQACILLLHRDTDYYPILHTILVYPHPFYSHIKQNLPGGIVAEGEQGRLGESWYRGPVVLSWDDVRRSAHDHNDGHNVVFHEFAHQLDSESGANDGAPLLPMRSSYIAWARVLSEEYQDLLDHIKKHNKSDIDAYGATNPAEFFAVITEYFFEKPIQLQKRHPELYEQFKNFYKLDTAAMIPTSENKNIEKRS
jgi:Mlc titration factor MtfA (ptsG expression regulator)